MGFKKILKDCNCDCLTNSVDCQPELIYLRKLNKNVVEEKDFLTYWERGKEAETDDCTAICGYRGLSIDLLSVDSAEAENSILNRYKTTFNINPKKGSYCLKFRMKKGSGKVKHTPYEGADSHHDLYKSDDFQVNSHIEQIAIIHFTNETNQN